MHTALQTRSTTLNRGIFGERVTTGTIGLLLLLLIGSTAAQADSATVDDGWRRTKFGWENSKLWNLSPEQRELPSSVPFEPAILSPAAERLLGVLHPLALAIGLSLLAVGTLQVTAHKPEAQAKEHTAIPSLALQACVGNVR